MLKKLLWAAATVHIKAQALFMLSIRKYLWQSDPSAWPALLASLERGDAEDNLPWAEVVDGH